jgi:hypothetical protein
VLADPTRFAELIDAMIADDPVLRLRAADAAEKVTRRRPELLAAHKPRLLDDVARVPQQEVRWHVAQMLPRLTLTAAERASAVELLLGYLNDNSRIVRTFTMQALADLADQDPRLRDRVVALLEHLTETGSPAMRTRGAKLLRQLDANDDA